MKLWRKIIGGNKCTNCGALIFRSTFRKQDGLCASCEESPRNARIRRSAVKVGKKPICAKCGSTESSLYNAARIAKSRGAFVYGEDWPLLLYCDHCKEYFCGRCQIDLGMNSGCPECQQILV